MIVKAFNFQTEEDSTLRSQGSGRHGELLCWLMLGDHSSLSGSGEASGPDPHMTYLASGAEESTTAMIHHIPELLHDTVTGER